ncbi:hypothetical protein [Pseudonocardia nigra]|uniref:hypothetical protein n=1 Tax=Pseudonocardia nigra TaxID=1921578 RepID=UPI001C5D19F0|nr:hypothetical protein [Pseudonocardia nigra]
MRARALLGAVPATGHLPTTAGPGRDDRLVQEPKMPTTTGQRGRSARVLLAPLLALGIAVGAAAAGPTPTVTHPDGSRLAIGWKLHCATKADGTRYCWTVQV